METILIHSYAIILPPLVLLLQYFRCTILTDFNRVASLLHNVFHLTDFTILPDRINCVGQSEHQQSRLIFCGLLSAASSKLIMFKLAPVGFIMSTTFFVETVFYTYVWRGLNRY